ncbi:PIG-U-domain-containing protein [Meredithblackwellia eburnea MCA 4105]
MERRLGSLLLVGAGLHLSLSLTSLPQLLVDRNELTTPLTSFTRLKEGHYLLKSLSLNPYNSGSFHHPPLILLLYDLGARSHVVWVAAETLTAYLIARIADGRSRGGGRRLLEGEEAGVWTPLRCAALYLLHPFTLLTVQARSTNTFANLALALTFAAGLDGSIVLALFSLSIATHLSMYPFLLLPPLIVLLYRTLYPEAVSAAPSLVENPIEKVEPVPHSPTSSITAAPSFLQFSIGAVTIFASHQLTLLGLSFWLTGGWEFLGSVYGVILTIPDLTPTIGLAWYFFIEMFDHFRMFFVGVFQLQVAIYSLPFTIFYRHDPLFAILMLVGVISLCKSYPLLSDFGLWHALLATYSELGLYTSHPLFLTCLSLYGLTLLPTFHYLWLYSGSGNANFFYASTLVWAISQGGILLEFMSAYGKREVGRGLGSEGRKLLKEGSWVLVQR